MNIDFTLEIPHLDFQTPAASIVDSGKNVYISFFARDQEAVGDWREGVYIKSPMFGRKRKVNISTFDDPLLGVKPAIKTDTEIVTPRFVYNKKTRKLKVV